MILVPRRLVTSVTKSLNVQLGSDVDTPTAWAVVVEDTEGNEPTGHTVAVDSDGVLTGQLPQGEYGLQLTATLPDSTTEHGSLVVESVRDLTVRYDDVEAPVGSLVPLAPRLWNHRRPVTFRDVGLGADDVLDTATGAVTIKADVDREATVSVIDDRGEAALGTISVKATANTVAASFRTSRRYVAAGDSIFEPVTVTGGTGPYVLTFEAAPDWALLEEAEVRGVVAEGGLIRVKATDAAGNSDTADIWLEVEQAPGLFLTIPSLDGPGNRKMPEGVRCIVEGGTAPFAFTLEDGPAGLTLDGETGEFGGDRPPLAGSYPVRVSVLDDAGQRAFASRVMEVPTPVFAITFEDIVVQANTLVRRQPTANAPVLRWSKESGPDVALRSIVRGTGQRTCALQSAGIGAPSLRRGAERPGGPEGRESPSPGPGSRVHHSRRPCATRYCGLRQHGRDQLRRRLDGQEDVRPRVAERQQFRARVLGGSGLDGHGRDALGGSGHQDCGLGPGYLHRDAHHPGRPEGWLFVRQCPWDVAILRRPQQRHGEHLGGQRAVDSRSATAPRP